MSNNPFTPAFGTVPEFVAGREAIFSDMRDAFQIGPGSPNLSTLLVGARGTGKTVCMSCICDDALEFGWLSVTTAVRPGMLEDIYEQTVRSARNFLGKADARVTSLSIGPISASWDRPEKLVGNWRTRMSDVLDELGKRDIGLVIAVDEVRASVPEMIELASVFQLFVLERRRVALVMAGLPYHVHQLLNDDSVSFLRRSMQYQLGRISDADVRIAVRKTFLFAGKDIAEDALEACVDATQGFAYMLQLVGYRTWNESDGGVVDLDDARRGIKAAQADMEEHIFRSTYRDLSDGDVSFLRAMLPDQTESRLATIAKRMGVKSNYASKYKARLLAQGVIGERGRANVLGFEIPGFRGFLEREVS